MPEYDYKCESCGKEFTIKLSVTEHDTQERKHKIQCPKCASTDVRHVIESFYVTTSRKS